jgi:hypothetical protein
MKTLVKSRLLSCIRSCITGAIGTLWSSSHPSPARWPTHSTGGTRGSLTSYRGLTPRTKRGRPGSSPLNGFGVRTFMRAPRSIAARSIPSTLTRSTSERWLPARPSRRGALLSCRNTAAGRANGRSPASPPRQTPRSRGVAAGLQALGNLDRSIASYSILDNGREFLIAYYLDDGGGALHETLFASRYGTDVEAVGAGAEADATRSSCIWYEDLRHAERYPGRAQMLRTLEADRELLDLVAAASTRARGPDQGWLGVLRRAQRPLGTPGGVGTAGDAHRGSPGIHGRGVCLPECHQWPTDRIPGGAARGPAHAIRPAPIALVSRTGHPEAHLRELTRTRSSRQLSAHTPSIRRSSRRNFNARPAPPAWP